MKTSMINNDYKKNVKKQLFIRIRKLYKNIRAFFLFIFGNFLRLLFVIFIVIVFLRRNSLFLFVKYHYNRYISTTIFQNKQVCENLVLNGVKYSNYQVIQEKINEFCNNNDKTIEWLRDEISKDIWIKSLLIRKDYRKNMLFINVVECVPFAIWIKNSKEIYLIDQFGTIINIEDEDFVKFDKLLLLKGDGFSSDDLSNFFNLLLIYNNIILDLKEIERIGNRRWNLIFKNGILVKFPEDEKDIISAWSNLNQLMQKDYVMNDVEIVDLRVNGKIYLKYKDNIVEKLKYEIK